MRCEARARPLSLCCSASTASMLEDCQVQGIPIPARGDGLVQMSSYVKFLLQNLGTQMNSKHKKSQEPSSLLSSTDVKIYDLAVLAVYLERFTVERSCCRFSSLECLCFWRVHARFFESQFTFLIDDRPKTTFFLRKFSSMPRFVPLSNLD